MCGAYGTVREKPSDVPDPGALARSQSLLVAFNLSFAWKMPYLLAPTLATVRQCPRDPCQTWIVMTRLLLVASRPQTLTEPPWRPLGLPAFPSGGRLPSARIGALPRPRMGLTPAASTAFPATSALSH